MSVEWADERWRLLPQRAVWWEARRTLIVADLHLGKAASFRAGGVPVPEVVEADLVRLDDAITASGGPGVVERIVIVGDLIHAACGRASAVIDAVAAWRRARANLDIVLIRGNHDQRAGDPPLEWNFRVADGPWMLDAVDRIGFVHDPDRAPEHGEPEHHVCIGGHLHPAVVMGDKLMSVRAACFWVRPGSMVLPAFGRFTGGHAICPRAGDRVFAVGRGEVVEAACEESSPRRSVRPERHWRQSTSAR